MNLFVYVAILTTIIGLFDFGVALNAFMRKSPNIGVGIGGTVGGFFTIFFSIMIASFENSLTDILMGGIIFLIILLVAYLVYSGYKEIQ